MKQLILFLVLLNFLCSSCSESAKQNPEQTSVEEGQSSSTFDDETRTNDSERALDDEDYVPFDNTWRNPALLPVGTSIGKLIRAYYLIGDFKAMSNYLITPKCLSQDEVIYKLRNYQWGYEMKLNNLEWLEDSTFILTYRTTINNTVGIEQMKGGIINDTVRIYFFPDQENHLKYLGDDDAYNDFCSLKNLTKRIQFQKDSDQLIPDAVNALTKLSLHLKEKTNLKGQIVGHTSSEGSTTYNMELSERRAKSVHQFLIRSGISEDRFHPIGMGNKSPIYSNETEEGRIKNRRVELIFTD